MALGPILGSGGLAIMIPPGALAVILASLGEFLIGRLLIAIVIPGLIMSVLYATYIVGRCWLQPSIAPPYEKMPTPLLEKVWDTVRYVLPLGILIFLVIGLIFLGVATPSEAAAAGAFGSLCLAALYRRLNWDVIKKSILATMRIAVMVFMILTGSTAFSQLLAFSGASAGLVKFVAGLTLPPSFSL